MHLEFLIVKVSLCLAYDHFLPAGDALYHVPLDVTHVAHAVRRLQGQVLVHEAVQCPVILRPETVPLPFLVQRDPEAALEALGDDREGPGRFRAQVGERHFWLGRWFRVQELCLLSV